MVITGTTLQELDRKKTAPGELGYHAREAIRIIDSLRPHGDYLEGIPLPHGGKFYIDPDGIHQENLPQGFDISAPDNRIISSVITRAKNTNAPVILITNDVSMRINAVVCGVETQGYHNEEIDDEDNIYTGRCDAYLSGKAFSTLMGEGVVAVNKEITFYSEDNHIIKSLVNKRSQTLRGCDNRNSVALDASKFMTVVFMLIGKVERSHSCNSKDSSNHFLTLAS